MKNLTHIYFLTFIIIKGELTCSSFPCLKKWLSNSRCDLACMNRLCSFDSSFKIDSPISDLIANSDCLYSRDSEICAFPLLGNGVCDQQCNSHQFGWDFGDCSFCSENCTLAMLENDVCDPECNNFYCANDNGKCGSAICGKDCTIDLFQDGCFLECTELDCEFYTTLCDESCGKGCLLKYTLDKICTPECYVESCFYDNGDCDCAPGCSREILLNQPCLGPSDPCNNARCKYKNGKCGSCSFWCFDNNLGNGVCDWYCNVPECRYDLGDCGCAPGCGLIYWNGKWWNTNQNLFNPNCLVPQCLYNAENIQDKFYFISLILTQINKWNFMDLENALVKGPLEDCSIQDLKDFNYLNLCNLNSPCYTESTLWCLGYSIKKSNYCLRASNSNCLVNAGQVYMGKPLSEGIKCPNNFIEGTQISALFYETDNYISKWCFVDPTHYTLRYPKLYFVQSHSEALCLGQGTYSDPFLSLYYAFTQVFHRFTKIILFEGVHIYKVNKDIEIFLRDNFLDPLNVNLGYELESLQIEGANPYNKSKVYWKDSLIISNPGRKIEFRHIEFVGDYLIRDDCDGTKDICYYCPFYNREKNLNENFEEVDEDDTTFYLNDCQKFANDNFFVFNRPAYFENVVFSNIRNQFNSLIKTSSSLNLVDVNFFKIQAKETGYVIDQECVLDCNEVDFTMIYSKIDFINYGYRNTIQLNTGNFLKIRNIRSVLIGSCYFNEIQIKQKLNSNVSKYLMNIITYNGTVSILDNDFSSLVVDNLISVNNEECKYEDLNLGVNSVYNQIHFLVRNNYFINSFFYDTFITYRMRDVLQNILIETLIGFDLVFSKPLIHIINLSGQVSDTSNFCDLVDFYLESTYLNGSLILLQNMNSIRIDLLTTKFLTEVKITDEFFSTILQKNGQKDNEKYLASYVLIFNPGEIICIDNSFNAYINKVEVLQAAGNYEKAKVGIIISNVINLNIENIRIISSVFRSRVSGLITIINSKNSQLSNILLVNSANYFQLISINSCEEVRIFSLILKNTLSAENSPIFIYNTYRFALFHSKLIETITFLGRCGGLEIIGNTLNYETYFVIKDNEFIKCSGGYVATCLAIDTISVKVFFDLNINGALFQDSKSESSPIIFISKFIKMSPMSSFKNANFINNTVKSQSMIKINLSGYYLLMKNWTFVNNTSAYLMQLEFDDLTDKLKLQDFSIVDNIVYDTGVLMHATNSRKLVQISNVIIQNLKGESGKGSNTAFFSSNVEVKINEITVSLAGHLATATESSLFEINGGIFFNLTEDAIFINKNSIFSLNNCQFYHNQGNIIVALKGSSIILSRCKIFENIYSRTEYAFIDIETMDKSLKNIFNDTEIFNNTSLDSDLIKVSNSLILASRLEIYSNHISNGIMHSFSATNSELIIDSSNFTNQKLSKSSSIIYLDSYSKLTLNSSNIKNNESDESGLIKTVNSEITVASCNFSQNLGHVIKSEDSKISVIFCEFNTNSGRTGTEIYIESSSIEIKSSYFSNFTSETEYSSSLFSINSNVSITFSIFQNSVGSISAIHTQECSKVSIANCYFNNIFSRELSAVYIEGLSIFGDNQITDSVFINNTSGNNGGALGVKNNNLILTDSILQTNSAYLRGGGLNIEISLCSKCEIYLTNVVINENKANIQGGGVMWIGSKPIISNDSKILNNSAICGENIASQIVKIQLLDKLPSINAYRVLENVPSGKKYDKKVLFGSYDSYNSLIKTDNSSLLNLNLINSKDSSISGSTIFKAENGIFTISNFTVTSSPGKTLFLEVSSPSVPKNPALNDNSQYISSQILMIKLRNCTNGEQILETSCKKCENSTFLIEPAKVCLSCPTGGICPGGDKVFVRPGYYRTSNFSKKIYDCDLFEACQGNNNNYNTLCLTGYTGIKCGVCETDYSKIASSTCVKCPNKESNLGIILSTVFGIFIISVSIIKASIKSVFSPKSKHSIYMKILMNYLQMVSLMINFNFNWHKYVFNFFRAHQTLTMTGASVVSVDCYLYTIGIKDKKDLYYIKLQLMIFFPLGVFFASFLIWIGICFLKETYEYLKRELILTLNVLFFLIYPSVVKVLFLHFGCDDFDIIGPYIFSDLAVKCWDLKYKVKTYVFVLPGIIVWAVGLPSLILLIMFKKRFKLHHEYNKITLGYLFNGYKRSAFYWEFIGIYRKLLIVSILVFVNKDFGSIQGLTLCVVLVLSIVMQHKFKPYNSKELNKLELYSLSTALLTNFCGLYYLNKDLSEQMKLFLFYLIFTSNILYLAYWSYRFFTLIKRFLLKKIPFLRRLSKLDGFESEFYVEEIYTQGSYFDKDENIKKYTFLTRPKENIEEFRIKNIKELYLEVFLHELQIKNQGFEQSIFNNE